jgi:heme A synthase
MTRSTRLFQSLALTTALMTLGLIVFGAVVRVTDSGLGCGNHWPLCNGTIFPPLDNLTAWIEWLHRLFAALIGLMGLATLGVALNAYRKHNRLVLTATVAAAGLFFFQSALGAFVVLFDLPPTMVTMHLGTAMLLLGALLLAALAATYKPKRYYPRDRFTALVYTTTALSLVIILTGALVRGSGATLACTDWPLCNGQVLPFEQGQLATIHMLHRVAVLAFGVTLGMVVWSAYKHRQERGTRLLAWAALAAYLVQAGIGALYVLSVAAPVWGASHVLFAAVTWGVLVTLSVIETMNSRVPSGEQETQWQPQSEPVLN